MRNLTKLFCISAILFSFAAGAFAQDTKSATATATIVTPITLTKLTDMSFGNIVPSATLAGTIILAPNSTVTLTNVTQLATPIATATVSAATFTVTGDAAKAYTITLPAGPITLTGPFGTMDAITFTSSPTPTGLLDGTGNQALSVGATLNVNAAQAAGTYISPNFDVTVNYN